MPKATILLNDFGADATITSNNEELNTPASLLSNEDHTRRWHSTDVVTAIQITIDAGTPMEWDTVYFGYTNGSPTATWRVTSNASTPLLFTTPAYDSGHVALRLSGTGSRNIWHAWHAASPTQNQRFVGIEILDQSNPDGFFSGGVVVVGNRFEPGFEADLGSSRGYSDRGTKIRMASGVERTRRLAVVSTLRLTWQYLQEVDQDFFDNLALTHGSFLPFVVKVEPENSAYQQRRIIYGTQEMRGAGYITEQAPYGYAGIELTMTEY